VTPTSGIEVSCAWTKGGGSDKTKIQTKIGSYPTDNNDGTTVYFGNKATCNVTNLIPGTSYYFRAWGESAGNYSSSYAQDMATTLAQNVEPKPSVETPGGWFQNPTTGRITKLPFYADFNRLFDSYSIPNTTGWVIVAILMSALLGLGVLSLTGRIWMSLAVSGASVVLWSWMEILPLWIVLIPIIIGGSYAFIRSRV